MFRSTKLVVFAVVFLLALASSAFALDTVTLRQQMWTWSSLEAVISESTHMGGEFGPTPPVVDIKEAWQCIEDARARICKIVADIRTAEEMAEARKVADEFVSMLDKEEEVGRSLHRLLDMQEKYLKVHRDI